MADVERVGTGRRASLSPSLDPSPSPFKIEGGGLEGRGTERVAATKEADWERWRMVRSEGFRRLVWMLLLDRWPGVWLLGRGAASLESSSSDSLSGMEGLALGAGDVAAIFWDRTTLVLRGDFSAGLPESAMML